MNAPRFLPAILKRGEDGYLKKDWNTAIKYYSLYFQKTFAFIEGTDKNLSPEESIKFFNYIECLFHITSKENTKNIFNIFEFYDIFKYFTIIIPHFVKYEMDLVTLDKFINSFGFLLDISITYQLFKEAIEIFENAINYIDEIISKTDDEDQQKLLQESKDKFEQKKNIIPKNIDEHDMNNDIEEDEEEFDKITKFENKKFPDRPEDAPLNIVFDGYIFKYYFKRKNDLVYICKSGKNRHKTNLIKCNARISIAYPITSKDFQNIPIKILESNHTCNKNEKSEVKRIITNAYLRQKVEEIYMSESPRPTRSQLIVKLYKIIEDETPEGEEKQTFSEVLVNSYYTELEKKFKKVDTDFSMVLKTARNDVFELFKYRFPESQGHSSQIICYSSQFQRSCIPESRFIFIDGTFDIAPHGFAQVLVILGQTANMNLPIAYLLLPNKTKDTYEKAFNMFKAEAKTQFATGATFITDFEKAEYQSVKRCFMERHNFIQLCYFHFTQSMNRHFQTYDKSKIITDLNSIANMLPFISERRVREVIDELFNYKETKAFAEYFERNYLNKFNFDDWSVYSKPNKETITNNVAESHNNLLSNRIGFSPSLQKFESKIVEIENEYYLRYYNKQFIPPRITRIDEDDFNEKFRNFISEIRRSDSMENDSSDYFKDADDIVILSSRSNDANEIDDIEFDDGDNDEEEKITDTPQRENRVQNSSDAQKVDIRKLKDEAQQILLRNSRLFNLAQPRSKERKQILENAYNEVKEIEPNIKKIQVQSWFFNNKNK